MNTKVLILIICLIISNQFIFSQNTQDSLQHNNIENKSLLNNNSKSLENIQSEYFVNTEIEHQKLIRNIFAIGFITLFIALIFIIVFYGNKIKKVNELITKQNVVVNSSKDQLVKIISVFNHLDQMVFITDKNGIIEWANDFSLSFLEQNYLTDKINLLKKFTDKNRLSINDNIAENKILKTYDNIFSEKAQWKIIPINNANNKFSNIVFISIDKISMQKIINDIY